LTVKIELLAQYDNFVRFVILERLRLGPSLEIDWVKTNRKHVIRFLRVGLSQRKKYLQAS